MRRLITMFALVVVLSMSAAPALAATGREFGAHHSAQAIEMGGFSGTHNPGMHQGFAGWDM